MYPITTRRFLATISYVTRYPNHGTSSVTISNSPPMSLDKKGKSASWLKTLGKPREQITPRGDKETPIDKIKPKATMDAERQEKAFRG